VSLAKFKGLDQELALKLIEHGQEGAVGSFVELFQGLDRDMALKLIELGRSQDVARNLGQFQGLDQEVALKLILIGPDTGQYVAEHLEKFQGLDYHDVALKLIKARAGRSVANNLEKFGDLDRHELALELIEAGNGSDILSYFEKFQGLDHCELALKLIEAGEARRVGNYLANFRGLDRDIALKLVKMGIGVAVAEHLESFQGLDDDLIGRLVDSALKEGQVLTACAVNARRPQPDKVLIKAFDDFGEAVTPEIYSTYAGLAQGEIPEEAGELGIRHSGVEGMSELMTRLREIRHDFISGQLEPQVILDSPIARQWLKTATRYESSEWGAHGEGAFTQTVEYYLEVRESLRPLPEGYVPSEVVHVAKIDVEKQAEFVHDQGFLVRYGELTASCKEALDLIDDEQASDKLRDRIKAKRDRLIVEIEVAMAKQENPKARANLEQQKARLAILGFESFDPLEALGQLVPLRKQFEEELRLLAFHAAFKLHPAEQNAKLSSDQERPAVPELSWLINFADHVTVQETLAKHERYAKDKETLKCLKGVLNVSALEQELARWRNQETRGTMDLGFVPNRSLATEFSGHFADACWASKEESILEDHPNFIGLTMVQNPGDPKFESIAGGAFLIETQDEFEEPLLVIRGLNPRENVVNQLSPEDFWKKLVGYLKPLAEAKGRKLAVVIDNHSGGAATNRPVLFDFLSELSKTMELVTLAEDEDTEFNGYNIRGCTYLVG